MALSKGTILENRYRIERLLSQGGMGAVYEGYDTNLKTRVAIKENFFQTPHSIRQFEQEALILARLRHPGLPRVSHHFSHEGRQYLVMDFISGADLWELVKEQGHPLDERQAIDYVIQVCDAVGYLHRRNPPIIHRDIKPQNIKITPEGEAILVDFGIAKLDMENSRTQTGAQGVTPGFSPPEQYSGEGTNPASDVYSLGATLYAVLTGKKPPNSISRLVGNAKFEAPHEINTTVSQRVSEAIGHAMQPQIEERPQSAQAWQQELQDVLEYLQTRPIVQTGSGSEDEETLKPGAMTATEVQKQAAQPAPAPEATDFWLIDGQGRSYKIMPHPLVLGRHAGADISIAEESISRRHAFIYKSSEQQCLIRDNNSSNGTFLNGQQLGADWQPINPGDILKIGSETFTLTAQEPSRPAAQIPAAVEDAATPRPGHGQDPPATAIPAMPDSTPTSPPPSQPASVPPATPVAQPKSSKPIVPAVIAAILVLAAIGGAYLIFGSSANSSSTATTTARQQSDQREATQVNPLADSLTETAEADSTAQAGQTTTAEAELEANSVANAPPETPTAEILTSTPTEAPLSPTPTEAPPTPTEGAPTPTEAPVEADVAAPEPTEAPATATPTEIAATATPTEPPTATATSRPAGPTVIPLGSDDSVETIGVREVIDVDINPRNPKEVYALVKGDGIYKSISGGNGPWAKMKLDGSGLTAFVIDPTNSARFFAPAWNAVLRSDDGGNSWQAFSNGLSSANRVVDVVTVDPTTPNLIYAGIGTTLVVSTDGGKTWQSNGYGNGLGGGRFTSIVVDPFNHDTILVGGEFGSIYKSVDSGRNFRQLDFTTGKGTFSLVAHPTRPDFYLAGINSFDAGIIKSENGADFSSTSNGLIFGGADSAYSAIVYAPANPDIIYTGSGYEDDRFAKGIFRSSDGGKLWEPINSGLSLNPTTGQPHYVKSIVVHPTDPNIVLAATGGGLFKTSNGGQSWSLR